MTAAEWAVTVGGALLIVLELWFFLGGRRRPSSRGLSETWRAR